MFNSIQTLLMGAALWSHAYAYDKSGQLYRHGQHHQHHNRGTTVSTPSGYSNLFSKSTKLPAFDDCINYEILSSSTDASTQCAQICNQDSTCNFFAIYNTPTASGAPYCGWWTDVFTTAQITESTTDQGEKISSAYGFNRGGSASSITGTTTTAGGATTTQASTSKTTTTSSTSPKPTTTSSSTSSVKSTTTTSTKKTSTTSSTVKSTTSSSKTSTTSSTTTKKTTSTSSTTTAKKTTSTIGTASTSSTTAATSSSTSGSLAGMPGFYINYFTGSALPPDANCFNYFYDLNAATDGVVKACYNYCEAQDGCVFFTTWIQHNSSELYNCAIYDTIFTVDQLTVTSQNGNSVTTAIGFAKGTDPDSGSYPTSYKTSSKCGVSAWISDSSLVFDNIGYNIVTFDQCHQYCISTGCTTFEFQPRVSNCVTYNSNVFSRISEDSNSNSYFYDTSCDTSSAVVGPTFKTTELTDSQRAAKCGVAGTAIGGLYTDSVPNSATSTRCGQWCAVYPVFFTYEWNSATGDCTCFAPTVDHSMVANSSSVYQFSSVDCLLETFLYTGLTSI